MIKDGHWTVVKNIALYYCNIWGKGKLRLYLINYDIDRIVVRLDRNTSKALKLSDYFLEFPKISEDELTLFELETGVDTEPLRELINIWR